MHRPATTSHPSWFCDSVRDEQHKEDDQKDSHGCFLLSQNLGVKVTEIPAYTEGLTFSMTKRKIIFEAL